MARTRIPRRPVSEWHRSTLERFAYMAIESTICGHPQGDEAEASRIFNAGLSAATRRELTPWALAGRDMAESSNYEHDLGQEE